MPLFDLAVEFTFQTTLWHIMIHITQSLVAKSSTVLKDTEQSPFVFKTCILNVPLTLSNPNFLYVILAYIITQSLVAKKCCSL